MIAWVICRFITDKRLKQTEIERQIALREFLALPEVSVTFKQLQDDYERDQTHECETVQRMSESYRKRKAFKDDGNVMPKQTFREFLQNNYENKI